MGIFVRGIAKHYKLGKIIGECVPSSPHTPRESCARSAVRFAPGWTGLRSAPCVHRRHTPQGAPVSKAWCALAFAPVAAFSACLCGSRAREALRAPAACGGVGVGTLVEQRARESHPHRPVPRTNAPAICLQGIICRGEGGRMSEDG
jgi:hypothetical protein